MSESYARFAPNFRSPLCTLVQTIWFKLSALSPLRKIKQTAATILRFWHDLKWAGCINHLNYIIKMKVAGMKFPVYQQHRRSPLGKHEGFPRGIARIIAHWHENWTCKLRHWILVINLIENSEHETARQQCTSTIKLHLLLRNVCIETVTETTLNYAQIKQIDVANHSRKAISKTSNSHHWHKLRHSHCSNSLPYHRDTISLTWHCIKWHEQAV